MKVTYCTCFNIVILVFTCSYSTHNKLASLLSPPISFPSLVGPAMDVVPQYYGPFHIHCVFSFILTLDTRSMYYIHNFIMGPFI